jgi:hypothetical protein
VRIVLMQLRQKSTSNSLLNSPFVREHAKPLPVEL